MTWMNEDWNLGVVSTQSPARSSLYHTSSLLSSTLDLFESVETQPSGLSFRVAQVWLEQISMRWSPIWQCFRNKQNIAQIYVSFTGGELVVQSSGIHEELQIASGNKNSPHQSMCSIPKQALRANLLSYMKINFALHNLVCEEETLCSPWGFIIVPFKWTETLTGIVWEKKRVLPLEKTRELLSPISGCFHTKNAIQDETGTNPGS